jgi:ubiquinone biosynthesis protein
MIIRAPAFAIRWLRRTTPATISPTEILRSAGWSPSLLNGCSAATALDPDINRWETAEPFLREWMRSELGPEAYYADRIIEVVRALKKVPELIDRLDQYYPPAGGAPPPPPLPEVAVIHREAWWGYALAGAIGAAVGAAALFVLG